MTDRDADPSLLAGQVKEAISRLSQGPDAQLAYLARLGSPESADELALELDDVLEAALAIPGFYTTDQRNALLALDQQLESMSGPENAELWTQRALRTSSEWTVVRELAKAALRTMSG